MEITILIDGEEKTFKTGLVPMLARRKFMEIQAEEEEILEQDGSIPAKKQIEFENRIASIITDVVFDSQFTVDQLLNGVTDEYFSEKLAEALFGKPNEENVSGDD